MNLETLTTNGFEIYRKAIHKADFPARVEAVHSGKKQQARLQESSEYILRDGLITNYLESIEPTFHINNLDSFLKWTHNELQHIFPHGKLVCGIGRLGKSGAHIQHVVARNFPLEYIQTLQGPDGLTSSPILAKWMKEQNPILFEPDLKANAIDLPTEWLDNFRRFKLVNIAAHGLRDVQKHTASYFSFSCIPGSLNANHAYLLNLMVPHLHAVLTRVLSNPKFKKVNSLKQRIKLTSREKEVLQWLSIGKSNWEIAQVIGLSEATVKNHVHHILLKLQVHTRFEAVAKAIHVNLICAS